ncbi:MAG: GPW/gp25 family protein [Bacillota bacterium]
METAREFLGRGWAFPVGVDDRGRVKMSREEEDIREAIWIILSTAKGERVMRPDFGCGIHDFIFASVNSATVSVIESSVREALTLFEPRVEVTGVQVSTERLAEGQLLLNIDYRIRSTNNRFNMVYPFYLTEGK